MKEYLETHAYISKNKKSNYQFELSKTRAECIANKYNSLCEEKDKEIERLKEELEKERYLVDKYTRQLTDEYKNTEYQCKEKERLNNIINECAEDILKEIQENHHLSCGVALTIRQKLIDYRELKGDGSND